MKFKRIIRNWKVYILGVITAVISLGLVALKNPSDFTITKNLDIFFTLFREVNMFYVDETDPEELIQESIKGMLKNLDPYTTFIPETDMDEFKFMTTGEYGGIGSLVRKSGDYAIIAEPYKGFPAQKAGLTAGDKILKIDNKSIKGLPLNKVSDMLKGVPNTELELEIEKAYTKKNETIVLKRKVIKIDNVPYYGMMDDEIGYIRLSGFTEGAGKEVKKALKELTSEKHAKSIILDLRSNPGGLLEEAVNVTNLFVEKGQEIVSTKGKVKQWNAAYKAKEQPFDTEIPVVVLVNRGSASASEIVSGAIQDLDRGVIIGERTFGKGLVQSTRNLSYNTKLKVTTAKYYIPSGRCIQALDYSHRNEDGSVGHIPDSLISEYNTKNGRTVKDGGGITPDIKIKPEKLSEIAVRIYVQNHIFDYATKFYTENEKIAPIEEFEITDKIYDSFVKYLIDQDFDYQTASEKKFEELLKTAKKEKYFSVAQQEFDALKKKLGHDKEKDLYIFKDEIKELLKEEIATRYYYQKGGIKSTFKNDPQLKKAIEVLKTNVYSSILNGSFQDTAKTKKEETAFIPLLRNNQKKEKIEIDLI